jgi:hypothetical protein
LAEPEITDHTMSPVPWEFCRGGTFPEKEIKCGNIQDNVDRDLVEWVGGRSLEIVVAR